MKLLLLVVLCGCVFADALNPLLGAFNAPQHIYKWEDFKKIYKKSYATIEEEIARFRIFVQHSINVEKHNAEEAKDGRHGFEVAINKFADLTTEEFAKMYNKYKSRPKTGQNPVFIPPSNVEDVDAVDWRTEGYVTGVKNQGQCGSCWAFSTTGSLEGQTFKKTGKLVSLSEQNLVDCSWSSGNTGCYGGVMDLAFEYIKANGIDSEASYPYKAEDGSCRFNKANVAATVTGYTDIKSESEADLQKAVQSVGPVSVAIDASHWSFQMYSKGVYNEEHCWQDRLDHGVLVVGYGTVNETDTDYWIVKNSWGDDWGLQGYIWMSRNKNNQCGIATEASYPLV